MNFPDLNIDTHVIAKWEAESELKKHTSSFVEEFKKLFSKDEYTISIRRNIMTGTNIKIESFEQFWHDWNKFKKLKGFL